MASVLIVEDDPHIVTFISSVLLTAGHVCVAAQSANQAKALLARHPDISLVLVDQNLGEPAEHSCGIAFVSWLRSEPRFQRLPVVVCSGDSRPTIIHQFIGHRIAGFIKKPFMAERLLADVSRVLQQSEDSIAT